MAPHIEGVFGTSAYYTYSRQPGRESSRTEVKWTRLGLGVITKGDFFAGFQAVVYVKGASGLHPCAGGNTDFSTCHQAVTGDTSSDQQRRRGDCRSRIPR